MVSVKPFAHEPFRHAPFARPGIACFGITVLGGKRRLPFVVAERGAYFALSDLEKVDFLLESGQRLVDFARAGVRDKFVDTAHFGAQGLQLRHIFCGDNTVF